MVKIDDVKSWLTSLLKSPSHAIEPPLGTGATVVESGVLCSSTAIALMNPLATVVPVVR